MASKKALLLCETRHVLLNYLILSATELSDWDVDLALTDTTAWKDETVGALERSGMFRKVLSLPMRELNLSNAQWSKEERRENERHPEALFGKTELSFDYTDVWFNLPSLSSQLLWALLVRKGSSEPDIHFIDEGTASYTLKPFEDPSSIGVWSVRRKYIDHIVDIWLAKAELKSGKGRVPLTVRQLNMSIVQDEKFSALLDSLFVASAIPSQKFVFFEECYIRNRHTANDLEVLEEIAGLVGKENIVVRLHPKTEVDRFTPFGFTVSPQDGSLWELMCLERDLSEKVFLTVKSSATFTSLAFCSRPPKVVVLKDIVEGYFPNKNSADFIEYLQRAQVVFGHSEANLLAPQSEEELKIIIEHL